ncbi:MAG: hypothetical protein ACFFA3_03490 [Promethearchaeota archaeon]
MLFSESQELTDARNFFNEGNLNEALQIIQKVEERGNLTEVEQNAFQIIKSDCLGCLGNYNESIKLAEIGYEEAKRLNIKFHSFDALLIQARSLQMLGKLDKSLEKIEKCEDFV